MRLFDWLTLVVNVTGSMAWIVQWVFNRYTLRRLAYHTRMVAILSGDTVLEKAQK